MNELHIFKENIYKMVFPIIKLEFLRFFSGNYPQQYIICNYIINFRLTKSLNLYQRYVINLISFSILGGIMKISHNECINYSKLRYFLVLFSLIQKCIFNWGVSVIWIHINIFSSSNYRSRKISMHLQNDISTDFIIMQSFKWI